MDTNDLFFSNLDNLTRLWRTLGTTVRSAADPANLHVSASWPHRLWFDVDAEPTAADRARLLATADALRRTLTVPVWQRLAPRSGSGGFGASGGLGDLRDDLARHGFALSFRQTVMGTDPTAVRRDLVSPPQLEFSDGADDVTTWTEVAARAFGYAIDQRAVARLRDRADSYLVVARRGAEPIGTGLLFGTGATAGLHMVGVAPEARRAGVAGAIMLHLLDAADQRGYRHAALQASAAGEGLYRKLGFTTYGRIENMTRAGDATR